MNLSVFPDKSAWLEARRHSIGGSDVAVVLGLSPFKSRFTLWAEKAGEVAPEDNAEESEAMEWGSRIEPLLREKWQSVTGRELEPLPRYSLLRNPKFPWLHYSPDGLFLPSGVFEAKTTSAFKASDWESAPPIHVQLQGQAGLLVAERSLVSYAVLIGGQRFRWCDMDAHPDAQATINETCREFMRCVETRTPPEPDGSDSTRSVLRRMYPAEIAEMEAVPLPDEAEAIIAERDEVARVALAADKIKDELDNRLKAMIGDAPAGRSPSGRIVTWMTKSRDGYAVEPTSWRELRVKPAKGEE